ncbi:endolytic transglycosylase MltG [Candidatus Kaiserbacteria bacterium]|nr:endolytic transglycosylase MltG [Candidatus Kaiserbacteria bacterium]
MDFERYWVIFLALAILVLIGYHYAFSPPANFPSGSVVKIVRGASAPEVATQLALMHVIAHPHVLRAVLRVSGGSVRIQAGPYLFNTPENLLTVAYRLVTGAYGIPPVRITFPEGETAREMAARVAAAFPDIPASKFLSAAQPYEGYLFPDTYLFLPSSDAESIVEAMRANFDTKTAPLADAIQASGRSLSEIVILASLVEKEARSSAVRHMVAGILWSRLQLGMPLQVDAVFGYIFNRDTYSPSSADLTVDSPYNTYTHIGLPPGPINNPGFDSLDAALHPTKTDYLYYLTGTDNQMHYATTYADHQANQKRYLK